MKRGSERRTVPVSAGEKFSDLVRACRAYFRNITENCRVFVQGAAVNREARVEQQHLGVEMELREVRELLVYLPFGLSRLVAVEVTAKVQQIAEEVSKAINVIKEMLDFSMGNSQLDLGKAISTLPTDPITVKIRLLLPTVYLIEHNQVQFSFPRSNNTTETSIRDYLRWKTGRNDKDLRLVCEGRLLQALPDRPSLFIVYFYRKKEVTLVVKWPQRLEFGLDLPVNAPLSTLFERVSGKINSEVSSFKLVYQGKQVPKQGSLADCGLTHGSLLWLIVHNGKLPVTIRLPNQQITIDLSPTDTISTLKSVLSPITFIPAAKMQLHSYGSVLSDEERVPTACFSGPALDLQVVCLVYVRCLSGKLTRLAVSGDMKGEDLAKQLHTMGVTSTANCKLTVGGKDLDPLLPLSAAGLTDRSVLHAESLGQ